ncbi:DNA-binding protein [Methanooceanicella nereidis]|nr:DNA-binding protein [Methanocella sp. CWC-04]
MRLQKGEIATIAILSCALFAIVSMFFLMGHETYQTYGPDSDVGDNVVVEGILLSKERTYTGGHLLLAVKSGSIIANVFVYSSCEDHYLFNGMSAGDHIKLKGTVKLYKGEKEVVAEKIMTNSN